MLLDFGRRKSAVPENDEIAIGHYHCLTDDRFFFDKSLPVSLTDDRFFFDKSLPVRDFALI